MKNGKTIKEEQQSAAGKEKLMHTDNREHFRRETKELPETFALKGIILDAPSPEKLRIWEEGYVICEKGICKGVYETIPQKYEGIFCIDYGDSLIIPGITDLHLHAPQFSFRGTGMDLELLDWLDQVTFPQEARYEDEEFAKEAYSLFVQEMKKSATARACIFATLHVPATMILTDLLEESGLKVFVGKVNMDRNSPETLCEKSAGQSLSSTRRWLEETEKRNYKNVRPILTPRFIPSCTDELMEGLAQIQREYSLPMQSHLSENPGEIEWVKDLRPDAEFYGQAYEKSGMFGKNCPTIMAHGVYCSFEEEELIKRNGVYLAHCPQSNRDLASGIAPAARYLREGMRVGIGTDVAGGSSLNMLRAMGDAIGMSKLYWRLLDEKIKPLSVTEAFYMATRGGGSFFGNVGSFEQEFEMDAVVLDDSSIPSPLRLSPKERLERFMYLGEERNVRAKYVNGKEIKRYE